MKKIEGKTIMEKSVHKEPIEDTHATLSNPLEKAPTNHIIEGDQNIHNIGQNKPTTPLLNIHEEGSIELLKIKSSHQYRHNI